MTDAALPMEHSRHHVSGGGLYTRSNTNGLGV
jgi:hypothetical protein